MGFELERVRTCGGERASRPPRPEDARRPVPSIRPPAAWAMGAFEGTADGISNETAWIDARGDFSRWHHLPVKRPSR